MLLHLPMGAATHIQTRPLHLARLEIGVVHGTGTIAGPSVWSLDAHSRAATIASIGTNASDSGSRLVEGAPRAIDKLACDILGLFGQVSCMGCSPNEGTARRRRPRL